MHWFKTKLIGAEKIWGGGGHRGFRTNLKQIDDQLPEWHACHPRAVKAAPVHHVSFLGHGFPAPVQVWVYFCFLLSSDHLGYLCSAFLHGADQLSKHLLTVLYCCLWRALLDEKKHFRKYTICVKYFSLYHDSFSPIIIEGKFLFFKAHKLLNYKTV